VNGSIPSPPFLTSVNVTYVPVGHGPSYAAVNPNTNMVYASNFFSNSTSVIDAKTNKVVETIRLKSTAAGVAVNPNTNIVYIAVELTNDQFAVDAVLTQRLEEWYLKMFLISHMASIPTFIVSLISDYNPKYLFPTLEVLGQDERFVQSLRKTKDQFDRRYDLIVEQRS
jgi:YVTN family beta-propeller protein